MAVQSPSAVFEILTAVATCERVTQALREYPERDHAIEVLEDDIAVGQLRLVEDLRELLRPVARNAWASADVPPPSHAYVDEKGRPLPNIPHPGMSNAA